MIISVIRCPVCKELLRMCYFSISQQAKRRVLICNKCYEDTEVPLFSVIGLGG